MRAETGVGPGEVLAVVDGEVHVVQCVVSGAVDELLGPVAGDHVAVVDQDGPDLDGDEEDHVEISLHGADEDEEAVCFWERVLESRWGFGGMTVTLKGERGEFDLLVWQRLDKAVKRVKGQRRPGSWNF